jgi:hypothetical protein
MFLNVIEKCWIITLHIYLSVCVCIFKQQHVLRGEEDDQEEEEGGGGGAKWNTKHVTKKLRTKTLKSNSVKV